MAFSGNIDLIQSEIIRSQRRSKNSAKEVKILAVTKRRSVDEINEILKDERITMIGENRLQEAQSKFHSVKKCKRHFIGNIQSRKIRDIVENFDSIESVSDVFHAQKISEEAQEIDKNIEIFIQVSITGEVQKSGVDPNRLDEYLSSISKMENIEIKGLMTMAKFGANKDELRETFGELKKLRDIFCKSYPSLTELSMGMSDDYQIAVEEGATLVRIGRLLFNG